MLDKKDVQWWVLEAQKHPESATDLIRLLADRLTFLDKQNEELRGELISLRRNQRSEATSAETAALQERIRELEMALKQGGTGQHFLVYAADRIEINSPLKAAQEHPRELPDGLSMLVCYPAAKLLIITDEAQAFNVALGELPVPQDGPALLGNPRNVAVILDQAVFERYRFLTLLTRGGYVYSLLAGSVTTIAKRQDKLIRNMIPGDPIIAAIPSYNADLFAISKKGRWIRFPEKSIAGAGSEVMELPKGDAIAGIVPLSQDRDLVFISTDGKLFMRHSNELKSRRAPGSYSGLLFKSQSIMGVTAGEEIIILTRRGKLLNIRSAELPFKAQTDSGAPIPGLSADDSVLTFTAY
jgi:DNA gyrase/topoisomerase IV subunit A